jgi:hypothetical protein
MLASGGGPGVVFAFLTPVPTMLAMSARMGLGHVFGGAHAG